MWAQIGQYHTWIFLGSPNLAGYEMLFGVLKMSGWNEFLHPHVRGTYPRAKPSRRLSTFDDGQNMPIPQSLNLYVGSPMWCRKPCLPIANLSSRISQRQIHARPAQTFIAQRQRLESRTSEERLQLGWNFFKIKARTIRMRALKVKKALIEKNNQSLWDGHFRFSVMFHGLGDLSYSMAASY